MSKFTVASVFTAVDKFSGPVNKMGRTTQSTFAKMDRQVRNFGSSAFSVAKKTALIGAAVAVPFIAAANSAVKFEEKMSNVSTLIDTTTESMASMSNEVLSMATRLPVSIDDLTTSLYDVRSAGIASDKAMGTLESSAKLSVTGLSSVAEATNITTSALNAFKIESLSAYETTNLLQKAVKFGKTTISELSQAFGATAPIVQSAGIQLQDFLAATSALTTTGTPAAQAQNQIKASIASMQGPTAEMLKIYKQLGVATEKELIAKSGGLVEAYKMVNKTASDLNLRQKKVWGSTEALASVTSLTGATNLAYNKTLKDMASGTDAVNEAFGKQEKTAKSNMQVLKNNLEVVSIKLGTALLPIVTKVAEALLPIVNNIVAWMDKNPKLVSQIGSLAVKAVALFGAISAVSFVVGVATKAFKIARIGMAVYNTVLGISFALQKSYPVAMASNAVALKAFNAVTKIAAVVQAAFNAVMNLNPVFLIITGVAALTLGVYALSKAMSSDTAAQKLNNEIKERTLEKSRDQIVNSTILFEKLRNLKVGTAAYTDALSEVDKMSPGIVEKYNLQAGAIDNINRAEKELTKSIIERMRTEAMTEIAQEKITEATRMQQEGPSFFQGIMGRTIPGMDAETINKIQSAQLMNQGTSIIKQQAQEENDSTGFISNTGSLKGFLNREEKTTKEEQTMKIEPTGEFAKYFKIVTGSGSSMPVTTTTN
jgi:TP901 family phage tail tape measure protein